MAIVVSYAHIKYARRIFGNGLMIFMHLKFGRLGKRIHLAFIGENVDLQSLNSQS